MVLTRSVRNVLTMTVALVALAASVWLVESNSARAASPTPIVYVATGENFPDALGAGPAAAMAKGPILLVTQNAIPGETAAELTRLSPDKIVIVGGTAVVSASVEAGLAGYAATVERIAGANRYDTAAKLSAATYPFSFDADTLDGQDSTAFVKKGEADSVTSAMITNESGVAKGTDDSGTIGTTLGTIASAVITAPAAGYVFAVADAQANYTHNVGTDTWLTFGISLSSSSLPQTQDNTDGVGANLPSDQYLQSISATNVMAVSAGANTVYFLGRQNSGTGSISFNDATLSVAYFPTSYGTVSALSTDEGSNDPAG